MDRKNALEYLTVSPTFVFQTSLNPEFEQTTQTDSKLMLKNKASPIIATDLLFPGRYGNNLLPGSFNRFTERF